MIFSNVYFFVSQYRSSNISKHKNKSEQHCVYISLLYYIIQVIAVVFEYILLMQKKGPQEYIYNEIKLIQDNEFHWIEQASPLKSCSVICLVTLTYSWF